MSVIVGSTRSTQICQVTKSWTLAVGLGHGLSMLPGPLEHLGADSTSSSMTMTTISSCTAQLDILTFGGYAGYAGQAFLKNKRWLGFESDESDEFSKLLICTKEESWNLTDPELCLTQVSGLGQFKPTLRRGCPGRLDQRDVFSD